MLLQPPHDCPLPRNYSGKVWVRPRNAALFLPAKRGKRAATLAKASSHPRHWLLQQGHMLPTWGKSERKEEIQVIPPPSTEPHGSQLSWVLDGNKEVSKPFLSSLRNLGSQLYLEQVSVCPKIQAPSVYVLIPHPSPQFPNKEWQHG